MRGPVDVEAVELRRHVIRIRARNHWWKRRDVTAGVRAYRNGKFWPCYCTVKAIDHYTGAPLVVVVTLAASGSSSTAASHSSSSRAPPRKPGIASASNASSRD